MDYNDCRWWRKGRPNLKREREREKSNKRSLDLDEKSKAISTAVLNVIYAFVYSQFLTEKKAQGALAEGGLVALSHQRIDDLVKWALCHASAYPPPLVQ